MKSALDVLGELSDSKRAAMLHILACNGKDNSLHIAEAIGVKQPSAYASLQELMKEDYVKTMPGEGTEKIYRLTSKGLASTFLLGCNYHDFLDYSKDHYPEAYSALVQLAKKMDSLEKRKIYLRKYFQYLFENNKLQDGASMNEKEAKRFKTWLALEVSMEIGSPDSVKGMANHYGITRQFLREAIDENLKNLQKAKAELEKSSA